MAKVSPLVLQARSAAHHAHCPYSHFHVGAVVQTDIGIFEGCNVENASYGLTICAERVALFHAATHGAKQFRRLAVSCISARESDHPESKMPCGACRQVIAELMPPEALVEIDGVGVWRVEELLPLAFRLPKESTPTPETEA